MTPPIAAYVDWHLARLERQGKKKQLIFVASPFRGNEITNILKAEGYCRTLAQAGHHPFAPHLLYPAFLDDSNPVERDAGIGAGLRIMEACDEVWFFGPLTEGMRKEAHHAARLGKTTWFLGTQEPSEELTEEI